MKTQAVYVRVTQEQMDQLLALQKKTNADSVADVARFLMFEHEKILTQIYNSILDIQRNQKRTYAHQRVIAKSILQIRWVTSKLMHLLLKLFGKELSTDYPLPTDQEKERFIDGEIEKIQTEVESAL